MRDNFLLDKGVIYLNHGSFGACPIEIMEEYWYWQKELEREPVRFMVDRWVELWDTARKALAEFVVSPMYNIAFIENSTYGANVVANSLPLGHGDEVLATNMEYGACKKAWLYHAKKKGFVYREVDLPWRFSSTKDILDAIDAGINNRTKVLFVSHILSPTGVIMPVKDIISLARSRGVITVIDGAHAPGQIPLNLDELQPDFYFGNCHKWMLTPKGSAFLYVSTDYQGIIEPPVISWGAEWDNPHPVRFIGDLEYQGTRDISAFLTIPKAIEFLKKNDLNKIRERAKRQMAWVAKELKDILGTLPITEDLNFFGQMYAHPLQQQIEAQKLRDFLWTRYKIEIPTPCVGDKCFIRASFQIYNEDEDYEIFLQAMKEFVADL